MLPADNLATQRRLVEALRDPACYPHPVDKVTLIETHISFVLLTGAYAYKIKKAVDLGFVDYSERARRHFFCNEELRLNRRLAPQIYLEVVEFGGTPQAPVWGGACEPFEFAVRMREFVQDELLDRELARGALSFEQVDVLAAAIADFHHSAPSAAFDSPWGTPAAIWGPVAANFNHLRAPLPTVAPRLVAALEEWSRNEHARLREVFFARKAAGFVRECHGDLHLGNMALLGRHPLIFDCIEFSPALRWIDIASDLAFLFMDLSERGRPDFAWRLLNDWLERTGDHGTLAVLRYYQVYRAMVRAKVASLLLCEDGISAGEREAAAGACANYLRHAASLTEPCRPVLVVTHGFSGSGKTTLARAVAQEVGAVCLRSDVERKRLHGLAPLERVASPVAGGLYCETAGEATYRRLEQLAAAALAAGYSVVVDAACLRAGQRRCLREAARRAGALFLLIDCRASPEALQARIEKRMRAGNDASDATLEVLERQRRDAEPLSSDEQGEALTFAGEESELAAFCAALRRRLGSDAAA